MLNNEEILKNLETMLEKMDSHDKKHFELIFDGRRQMDFVMILELFGQIEINQREQILKGIRNVISERISKMIPKEYVELFYKCICGVIVEYKEQGEETSMYCPNCGKFLGFTYNKKEKYCGAKLVYERKDKQWIW